jgi:hypothetical protein
MKTMNYLPALFFALGTILLAGCKVAEETKINADGSGIYSLSFDISEMLKSGNFKDTNMKKTDISKDLTKYFEERKDSIYKLSQAEQAKLSKLKNYHVHLIADPEMMLYKITVTYRFKEFSELKDFGTFIKDQRIPEIETFFRAIQNTSTTDNHPLEFNKSFVTDYSGDKFSIKMAPEAMEKAVRKKDPNMKNDSETAQALNINMRYSFPKKISKISNSSATVSADFKGFEITANAYDLNHNPEIFNTEVIF